MAYEALDALNSLANQATKEGEVGMEEESKTNGETEEEEDKKPAAKEPEDGTKDEDKESADDEKQEEGSETIPPTPENPSPSKGSAKETPASNASEQVSRHTIRWPKTKRVLMINGVKKITYPFLSNRDPKDVEFVKVLLDLKPYAAGHGRKAEVWAEVAKRVSEATGPDGLPLFGPDGIGDRALRDRFTNLLKTLGHMSTQEKEEQPSSGFWIQCKDMVYRYEAWAKKEGKTSLIKKHEDPPSKAATYTIKTSTSSTTGAKTRTVRTPTSTAAQPRLTYVPLMYQNGNYVPAETTAPPPRQQAASAAAKSGATAPAVTPYDTSGLKDMVTNVRELMSINQELEFQRLARKRKREELEERQLSLEREQFEEQRRHQKYLREQDALDREEARKTQASQTEMMMKILGLMQNQLEGKDGDSEK